MRRYDILTLAMGVMSLVLGVTGHGAAAGVFGLCGVLFAITRRNDDD
ncbi:hypothetical protein [Bifidobacterium primatium]|nr:hypothetical protein [Bifidobacterium primatium]